MLPNRFYFESPSQETFQPAYLGRTDRLKTHGDYFVPPWSPAFAISRDQGELRCILNVCPHRQARLLEDGGNQDRILCRMHGWNWNMIGQNAHCPGFDETRDLAEYPVSRKGGWIFLPGTPVEKALEDCQALHFEEYRLMETNRFTYDCSWIEYVDVYLDVNHVKYIHPALRSWVDISATRIDLGTNWSLHQAPFRAVKPHGLAGEWWNRMAELVPEAAEESVRWMHIFPNILVEDYGGFFIGVALVVPRGKQIDVYEEVWVRPDLYEDRELCQAFSRMFLEIEKEDAELLMATRKGREALYASGIESSGPYQKPTEEAMEHFHRWLIQRENPR